MGAMSKPRRGSQGHAACNCGTKYDVELVAKIMQTIEHHNEDKAIAPCSACLRDTMLLVAALAHFDSATLVADTAPAGKGLSQLFAERAYERIETALKVLVNRVELPLAVRH
jgi:hypothetical protein